MKKDTLFTLLKIAGVLGALYLFLVGIKGMSSAIKHMGADVAENIFICQTLLEVFFQNFVFRPKT